MPARCPIEALALAMALLLSGIATRADEALLARLREGGHVALMRHANAPGTGDPPGLDLADCGTQRNLDEEGRAQARRAGEAFRRQGIASARVLSSRWCRARETAELLGLGPVEHLPALDSSFGDSGASLDRTRELGAFIAGLPPDMPVVLVSHQVNITALTGIVPASGEALVLEAKDPGGLKVVGRVPF